MNGNHREARSSFEHPIGNLEQARRSHDLLRAALHSRPRTRAELERRTRLRWVLGAVIALGLAVALGLLLPT
jgi:hypothetical protein